MTPLRPRMLKDMQIRNLATSTQRAYVEHVSRFARHFGRSPARLGPEEIRAYQVYLANEKQLAPASMVITVAALRFLYTVTLQKTWSVEAVIPAPKAPQTLPLVLSPAEVVQFLDCVAAPKHRTILTTCYAAGLRISEAVRLTPPAIDSQRMVLRVEHGKGQKDCYVMLSPTLLQIRRTPLLEVAICRSPARRASMRHPSSRLSEHDAARATAPRRYRAAHDVRLPCSVRRTGAGRRAARPCGERSRTGRRATENGAG